MTLFSDLNLSEPVLRALADMGFSAPTDIQARGTGSDRLDVYKRQQIALGALNFEQITVSQISAVRGKKADGSTPFQANNPIYLLYGGPKR